MPSTLIFSCEARYAGGFIGPGGTHIKKAQTATGCNIQTKDASDDRVDFWITGASTEQVQSTIDFFIGLVEERIANYKPYVCIRLDEEMCSDLVGPLGANIRRINALVGGGARISTCDDLAVVRGSREKVYVAIGLIAEHINTFVQRKDPNSLTRASLDQGLDAMMAERSGECPADEPAAAVAGLRGRLAPRSTYERADDHQNRAPKSCKATSAKRARRTSLDDLLRQRREEHGRQSLDDLLEHGPPPAQYSRRELFVRHLPPGCTEEVLRQTFEAHGDVKTARLARNSQGEPRGFGFVEFRREANASAALQQMNHTPLPGFNGKIILEMALENRRGNSSPQVNDDDDEAAEAEAAAAEAEEEAAERPRKRAVSSGALVMPGDKRARPKATHTGVIEHVDWRTCFAYVTISTGDEIFVHRKNLPNDGKGVVLKKGDVISYSLDTYNDRPSAVDVTLTKPGAPAARSTAPVAQDLPSAHAAPSLAPGGESQAVLQRRTARFGALPASNKRPAASEDVEAGEADEAEESFASKRARLQAFVKGNGKAASSKPLASSREASGPALPPTPAAAPGPALAPALEVSARLYCLTGGNPLQKVLRNIVLAALRSPALDRLRTRSSGSVNAGIIGNFLYGQNSHFSAAEKALVRTEIRRAGGIPWWLEQFTEFEIVKRGTVTFVGVAAPPGRSSGSSGSSSGSGCGGGGGSNGGGGGGLRPQAPARPAPSAKALGKRTAAAAAQGIIVAYFVPSGLSGRLSDSRSMQLARECGCELLESTASRLSLSGAPSQIRHAAQLILKLHGVKDGPPELRLLSNQDQTDLVHGDGGNFDLGRRGIRLRTAGTSQVSARPPCCSSGRSRSARSRSRPPTPACARSRSKGGPTARRHRPRRRSSRPCMASRSYGSELWLGGSAASGGGSEAAEQERRRESSEPQAAADSTRGAARLKRPAAESVAAPAPASAAAEAAPLPSPAGSSIAPVAPPDAELQQRVLALEGENRRLERLEAELQGKLREQQAMAQAEAPQTVDLDAFKRRSFAFRQYIALLRSVAGAGAKKEWTNFRVRRSMIVPAFSLDHKGALVEIKGDAILVSSHSNVKQLRRRTAVDWGAYVRPTSPPRASSLWSRTPTRTASTSARVLAGWWSCATRRRQSLCHCSPTRWRAS